MARPDAFKVVIDPTNWYQYKKVADRLGAKDITQALRKRVKAAGKIGVDGIKEELAKPSPDSGRAEGDGRRLLSAATRINLSFSQRGAGVKFVTAASRLPATQKGLLLVYNKPKFRHPVYAQDGRERVWVEQKGRPYFGKVLEGLMDKKIYDGITAAMDDAQKALAGRYQSVRKTL